MSGLVWVSWLGKPDIAGNKLSQKGLDFGRDQSVTADDTRVLTTRDPAPPAIRLLRGIGGDGTRCRLPTKKGSQHGKQQG